MSPRGRGFLPTTAYTGRVLPKGIPLSIFKYMKKVRVSLVEVYEMAGKSVISVCKKPKRATLFPRNGM